MSNSEAPNGIISSFVLLDSLECDFNVIRKDLIGTWGFTPINEEMSDENYMFETPEGQLIVCSYIPAPIPEKEAEENAKHNYFWKNGVEAVSKHQAQVLIAIMKEEDPAVASTLYIKVVASVLSLPNAIGVYQYPTVHEKAFFLDLSKDVSVDNLPIMLLLYIGLYQDEQGANGYTMGLRKFGYDEIEVVNSDVSPNEMLLFLDSIASYIIHEQVVLQDNETIGFDENQHLQITKSKGISMEGDTLKIAYMKKDIIPA